MGRGAPAGEVAAVLQAKPGRSITVSGVHKTFRIPSGKYLTFRERAAHPLRSPTYDELPALEDVSFDVRRGEFFGVVGRNGSGKSTLLKCIAGIYDVDQGSISVTSRPSPVIELGVGFEQDLPARDNVLINGLMLGLSRHEAEARLEDVIAFAELEEYRQLELKHYSTGMRLRLAFSIAIRADADILLADEVLAVGDASFQQKCFAEFDRMKAEGRTIVFVTHDMDAVERYCDRAIALERGQVVGAGDAAEIIELYEQLNAGVTPPPLTRPAEPPAADEAVHLRPSAFGDDVRHFLALTLMLARTEFKLHYHGSVLGYLWAVLRPLMMFGVLFFVLTEVLTFGQGVAHFPVYLLTAIVMYTYFSEATSAAVTCLTDRRDLLSKMRFPRLAIPLSVTLSALFNLGMNLLPVLAFALASGVTPRLSWLELPLLIAFLVAFATGIGTLLSTVYVRYRDTTQLWAVALQMLFYASPILYVIGRVPDSVQPLMAANPLAAVITQARKALLDPAAPSAAESIGGVGALLVPIGLVAGLLILGIWVFHRDAPRLVERL
jgi:ABC-2 type transport system permease protein